MIPNIGLIVAMYAICRLVQVPIEATARQEKWLGLPLLPRWVALATVSVVGIMVIGLLALVLLIGSAAPMPYGL
jgi:hypothetical protein